MLIKNTWTQTLRIYLLMNKLGCGDVHNNEYLLTVENIHKLFEGMWETREIPEDCFY